MGAQIHLHILQTKDQKLGKRFSKTVNFTSLPYCKTTLITLPNWNGIFGSRCPQTGKQIGEKKIKLPLDRNYLCWKKLRATSGLIKPRGMLCSKKDGKFNYIIMAKTLAAKVIRWNTYPKATMVLIPSVTDWAGWTKRNKEMALFGKAQYYWKKTGT